MCPNKHLERRTARERERSKGMSWREQGGQAHRQTEDKEHTVPRKHPERTATCESEVERRVRKQMGLESCPKATRTKNTEQWREKWGTGDKGRFLWPKAPREKNRNGDREIRRQVGNRQGDKYGNKWDQKGGRSHYTKRSLPHIYIYICMYVCMYVYVCEIS